MKKTTLYSVFIVGLVMHVFLNFFAFTSLAVGSDYDKYLSGEYYFRARAILTAPQDPNLQFNTELDYSDPKNLLLVNSGWELIAYDPHGPSCTVEYGDDVIEDFPINRLRFVSRADSDVFYGKVLTREQYDAHINEIAEDPSQRKALGTEKMLPNGRENEVRLFALILTAVTPAVLLYVYRHNEYISRLILIIWVVLCAVYDAVLIHSLV